MAVSARRLPRLEPMRPASEGPARELRDLLAQSRDRRFVVQLSGDERAPRASIRADGFEQAALSFVETFAADINANEVNVAVTDCRTGERLCFSLAI